jgi:hypothetical protein
MWKEANILSVIFVYLSKLCFVTLVLGNTVFLPCIFVVFIMNVYIIIYVYTVTWCTPLIRQVLVRMIVSLLFGYIYDTNF